MATYNLYWISRSDKLFNERGSYRKISTLTFEPGTFRDISMSYHSFLRVHYSVIFIRLRKYLALSETLIDLSLL